jgi:hypothetical protein
MKSKIVAGCTVVIAALLSGPLSAHHASALFETTTPVWVKGTVVRYVWANPHSAIIVEQKGKDDKVVRWALESSAPIQGLESRGFTRDSFKSGDIVEACGFAPRSASGSRPETPSQDNISSGPVWLEGADRVITARLLVTPRGTTGEWSRYGPLELCTK